MTTITFDLDDAQAAEAQAELDRRNTANGTSITLGDLCQLEAVYALHLSPAQLLDKEKAEIAEKYDTLSKDDQDAIKAIIAK